jgi:hypothetical protein
MAESKRLGVLLAAEPEEDTFGRLNIPPDPYNNQSVFTLGNLPFIAFTILRVGDVRPVKILLNEAVLTPM